MKAAVPREIIDSGGGFEEDDRRPGRDRRPAGDVFRHPRDFFRIVAQDSEEHYWFPQREADTFEDDVFATIDRAAIEEELRQNPVPGLRFVYYDLPRALRTLRKKLRESEKLLDSLGRD